MIMDWFMRPEYGTSLGTSWNTHQTGLGSWKSWGSWGLRSLSISIKNQDREGSEFHSAVWCLSTQPGIFILRWTIRDWFYSRDNRKFALWYGPSNLLMLRGNQVTALSSDVWNCLCSVHAMVSFWRLFGVFVIYSSLTVLELAMKFIVIGSTKKSVSGEMARYFPKALPHTWRLIPQKIGNTIIYSPINSNRTIPTMRCLHNLMSGIPL